MKKESWNQNIQLCNNKYLQFNLTDNGKGMDEEQLKQVIQNYSDKNKKSSIGLSNVYRRLNLLYGVAMSEFHDKWKEKEQR